MTSAFKINKLKTSKQKDVIGFSALFITVHVTLSFVGFQVVAKQRYITELPRNRSPTFRVTMTSISCVISPYRGRAFDVIVKIHVIKSSIRSIMERQDQKIISL